MSFKWRKALALAFVALALTGLVFAGVVLALGLAPPAAALVAITVVAPAVQMIGVLATQKKIDIIAALLAAARAAPAFCASAFVSIVTSLTIAIRGAPSVLTELLNTLTVAFDRMTSDIGDFWRAKGGRMAAARGRDRGWMTVTA